MSLLPVYTVISFSLPYIYSILLNNLIYNRRKRKSPLIQVFVREEWGLITFSFPRGESQMCPSSLDSTQLSVKFRGWGVIRDVAYKQPVIIPPQLRGLVSFSRSLYTLQHLYDKKVWQILFNVKATIFYTCKTDFSNSRPLRCRSQSLLSVLVKPVGAVVILVTVRVCVSVFMCACIHACVYTTCRSPFPISIQLSALHTHKEEGSGPWTHRLGVMVQH